jgi:hypothetical protein
MFPSPSRLLTLALWVLVLDSVLLVPLAWRTRQLLQDWTAWNTAAAVAAVSAAPEPQPVRP